MAARRFVLLIVVIAAALVPATSVASPRYKTRVIVSLRYPAFHGTLRSRAKACARHRNVKLFRKQRHRHDKLLGVDVTNRNAEWSIPIGNKLPSGASYYVRAAAKGRCKQAKSKVLTIG
jgi:hypothetical protein